MKKMKAMNACVNCKKTDVQHAYSGCTLRVWKRAKEIVWWCWWDGRWSRRSWWLFIRRDERRRDKCPSLATQPLSPAATNNSSKISLTLVHVSSKLTPNFSLSFKPHTSLTPTSRILESRRRIIIYQHWRMQDFRSVKLAICCSRRKNRRRKWCNSTKKCKSNLKTSSQNTALVKSLMYVGF